VPLARLMVSRARVRGCRRLCSAGGAVAVAWLAGDSSAAPPEEFDWGVLLELVVLELDDGRRLVIHAMPMRAMYRDLLPHLMTPDTPPTSNDVSVTDELVDALANEAECGSNVGKLRGRGRPRLGNGPSEIVPVRLDPQLRRALEERAADEHTTQSDLIRRALRTFLKVG
jgi:hypothetical protein